MQSFVVGAAVVVEAVKLYASGLQIKKDHISRVSKQEIEKHILMELYMRREWDKKEETIHDTSTNPKDALHWALVYGAPEEIVRALVITDPSALKNANRDRALPLHTAGAHGVSCDILHIVYDGYKYALTAKQEDGRVPLSSAFKNKRYLDDIEPVKLLASGGAVAIKDDNGKLPIDYAREEGASDEVLNTLERIHDVFLAGEGSKLSPSIIERIDRLAMEIGLEFDSNTKKPSEKVALLEIEIFGDKMVGKLLSRINALEEEIAPCEPILSQRLNYYLSMD